ncbi:hypothetical protein HF521_013228 [Silurus meridionalis]|uniref:Uncharacterized protein n=1 Tax=Silurus meridionalis TaxID=175797 RepID=A0A8T0AAU6_SILME|nr:hypothetical protein HF521_013228 [Silurus meridionalis]
MSDRSNTSFSMPEPSNTPGGPVSKFHMKWDPNGTELHTLQCARTQRNSAQEHSGTVHKNTVEQCARTQWNSAEQCGTVRKNTAEQCTRTQWNSAQEHSGTVRKNTAEQCRTVRNMRKNTAEQCGTVQNSAEQCARTQRNSAEQRAMPFSYLLPALVSHCCVFAVFALLCVLLCVTPWSWRSSLGTGIRI